MYTKYLVAFLFVILVSVSFLSCKDTITANQLDSTVIPSSNVSYSKYIQPVFNLKCISCHGNGETDGGINLTTWAGTTADPSVVSPGFPDNSSIVWCTEGKPGFSPMPPVGSPYKPFTTNQIDGLKTWIKEGAKNN